MRRPRLALVVAGLAALAGCGGGQALADPPTTLRGPLTEVVVTGAPLPESPTSTEAPLPTLVAPSEEVLPALVAPITVPQGSGPVPTDAISSVDNPRRPIGVPLGPDEANTRCQVTIVGDSLTVAAYDDLVVSLWAGGCVVVGVGAKGGANTWYGIRMAEDLVAAGQMGPIVLAALGTNDCSTNPAEFDRAIERFLRVTGPDRVVVWPTTNISTVTPYCQPQGDEVANERIRAAGARHANVRVADWWTLAVEHPEWHPDGVHHRSDGRRLWAAFLSDAVSEAAGTLG